jgi:hypothetical protein
VLDELTEIATALLWEAGFISHKVHLSMSVEFAG